MSKPTRLQIDDSAMIIEPVGMDRIWCFRKQVHVPLDLISQVSVTYRPTSLPTGWRGPGLDFMGKLAGTFHPNGERHFWNYSGSGPALQLVLDPGHDFQEIIVSVDDPEEAAQRIRRAIARTQSTG